MLLMSSNRAFVFAVHLIVSIFFNYLRRLLMATTR